MATQRLDDSPAPAQVAPDVIAVVERGLQWAKQHPGDAARIRELTQDFASKSADEQQALVHGVLALLKQPS